MTMPKDEIYAEMGNAWKTYLRALEKSINVLAKDIDEAKELAGVCTGEWCEATEHVFDELNNALYSISEPRWSDAECTKRIKQLKRQLYDIYVNYRGIFQNRNAIAA